MVAAVMDVAADVEIDKVIGGIRSKYARGDNPKFYIASDVYRAMSTAERGAVRQVRQESTESGGRGGGAANTTPTNDELSRSVSQLTSLIKGVARGRKPEYNSDNSLNLSVHDEITDDRKRAAQKSNLTRQENKKGKRE